MPEISATRWFARPDSHRDGMCSRMEPMDTTRAWATGAPFHLDAGEANMALASGSEDEMGRGWPPGCHISPRPLSDPHKHWLKSGINRPFRPPP